MKQSATIRTKDILHLRSSFDPGGTETLLLNLFNHQQEEFRIHLVLLKNGSLIERLQEKHGNRIYRWFRKRFFDWRVFAKMQRLVSEKQIDIVHTHQFIELVYAVFLKARYPHLRLIHQIHLMFQRKNLAFYLERFLSQQFARVVTVSNASKEELILSFGFRSDKISVLYNAVQFTDSGALNLPAVNEKLQVPLHPNRINVVMVANFVWGKDHETLFKAYDSFIREGLPQVNLYFIGRETDISERLKKQYLTQEDLNSGRIVFTGPIPDARTLLPAFDLVAMSCFSETFNMALVEAAAMGKVVLASDIPAFRELSENGRYFHHFKTGDALDLFASLQYLIHNFAEVSRVNHALYYRNKFGFDAFLRGLNDIYKS